MFWRLLPTLIGIPISARLIFTKLSYFYNGWLDFTYPFLTCFYTSCLLPYLLIPVLQIIFLSRKKSLAELITFLCTPLLLIILLKNVERSGNFALISIVLFVTVLINIGGTLYFIEKALFTAKTEQSKYKLRSNKRAVVIEQSQNTGKKDLSDSHYIDEIELIHTCKYVKLKNERGSSGESEDF